MDSRSSTAAAAHTNVTTPMLVGVLEEGSVFQVNWTHQQQPCARWS